MGQSHSSNLTDNQWDNLNTDDNSSASYVNKAVKSVNSINSVDKLNDIFTKYKSTPYLANYNTTTSINESAQSETSPFISSEMYNYIVNKNKPDNNIQKGGGKSDESSASSTSSSSYNIRDCKNCRNKIKNEKVAKTKKASEAKGAKEVKGEKVEKALEKLPKKASKKAPKKAPEKIESQASDDGISKDDEADDDDDTVSNASESEPTQFGNKYKSKSSFNNSTDNLSYISSAGNSANSANSEELSGGSISNNNDYLPPSSINTTDINMISESS